MIAFSRRSLLAGATLMAGLPARKLWAAPGIALPKLALPPAETAPEIHFTLADGTPRTLADYRGKGVVLNFWATWCAPCVAEMPALATLAGLVRDANVAILPLSSDRGGADAVARFYRDRGVEGLPIVLDARGEASHVFGARGIPTTVLIDREGRERGRVEGAVDWADPSAVAAVRALGTS